MLDRLEVEAVWVGFLDGILVGFEGAMLFVGGLVRWTGFAGSLCGMIRLPANMSNLFGAVDFALLGIELMGTGFFMLVRVLDAEGSPFGVFGGT